MCFVNFPCTQENQNVEAYQYQVEIFYQTIKDIHSNNELLVVFGKDYCQELPALSHTGKAVDPQSLNNPFRNAEENSGKKTPDGYPH